MGEQEPRGPRVGDILTILRSIEDRLVLVEILIGLVVTLRRVANLLLFDSEDSSLRLPPVSEDGDSWWLVGTWGFPWNDSRKPPQADELAAAERWSWS